jgi:hypothetical protein
MEIEIRGMRNNKHIFSYSLILLFSLCAAGEARAAKMCVRGTQTNQSASKTDGSWVIANNCAVGSRSPNCGAFLDAAGAYDGTGAPTNYQCSGVIIAGISEARAAGGNCLCKMTYPYAGAWVLSNSPNWGNGCGEVCACHASRIWSEDDGIFYKSFQLALTSGSN